MPPVDQATCNFLLGEADTPSMTKWALWVHLYQLAMAFK